MRRRAAKGGVVHKGAITGGGSYGADGIMRGMDRSVAWRAALLQGLLVGTAAAVLALALPRSFFEDWGWLAGPGVWAVCALAVAAALRLPAVWVLAGAALAGLPMLVGVAVGVHWLGLPLALLVLGAWCGRIGHEVPVTA
jgi:hypothetical protein